MAPGTLIAALAYLFGRSYTSAYFDYFGLDVDVLGFSDQALAIRSVRVLWLILLTAFLGLMAIGLMYPIHWRLFRPGHERALRKLLVVAVLLSVVMGGIVAALTFTNAIPLSSTQSFSLTALCVATIWYSYFLWSRYRALVHFRSEQFAGRLLVTAGFSGVLSLLLFSLTTVLASSYGRDDAYLHSQVIEWAFPEVTLDTKERLYLGGSGVAEMALSVTAGADSTFKYRYSNLALLAAGSGKLIIVPQNWTIDYGFALVLRDDSEVRVQYLNRPI